MRDGVKIAIDLWLPPRLAKDQKIPAIVHLTPYWRAYGRPQWSLELDSNLDEAQTYNAAGYAFLLADVRGTGASFGSRPHPFSKDEVADSREIVEWIVKQPWSDGQIAAHGVSYPANAAEFLAAIDHPAVKALAPRFGDFDPYAHLFWPGGVFNERFARVWSLGNKFMDSNDICGLQGLMGRDCGQTRQYATGVKPVDEDIDGTLLAAAVEQHKANADPYEAAKSVDFSDDLFTAEKVPLSSFSPFAQKAHAEHSGAALFIWASWFDADTADGALSRFFTFSNPQQVVIGPWSHGAGHDANPYEPQEKPPEPSESEQMAQVIRFFDGWMKKGAPSPPRRELKYYTLGEDSWKTTDRWPPEGMMNRRWYFAADASLSTEPPKGREGSDKYKVNYGATTGIRNRWYTQAGGFDVVYPNRANEDKKLLTYTSPPLGEDTEITGHPVVSLQVSSTHEDGAFHVYLEDVNETGRVTYLGEGILRAINRKISTATPPYRVFGPFHSCRREDAMPLVPGETAELRFALFPVSVLIRKGHRIRIAVAGHDHFNFARIPPSGDPEIEIARNLLHPSYIDLPVIERR